MKRAVESTEEFKARIASITGDKSEHITGRRQPLPMFGAQEASDQIEETASTMTVMDQSA